MNRAWINQHQVSIDMPRGNGQGQSVPLPRGVFRGMLAANVDARENLMIRFEIEFENEIVVVLRRAENAARLAFRSGLSHDAAVVHEEFGVARFLLPTRKIFAIEQPDPVLFGKKLLRGEDGEREKNQLDSAHDQ